MSNADPNFDLVVETWVDIINGQDNVAASIHSGRRISLGDPFGPRM